jgi:hypothetical protein
VKTHTPDEGSNKLCEARLMEYRVHEQALSTKNGLVFWPADDYALDIMFTVWFGMVDTEIDFRI